MNDSSLTAEQVDSAQFGVRAVEHDGGASHYVTFNGRICNADEKTELVRRANALPAVEARLKEAMELLRRVANPNQYGDPAPREMIPLRSVARVFLAKVQP